MNKKTQNTPKLPADKGDSKTKTKNAAETTFSAFVKPQGPQTAQTEEDQTHLAYDETVEYSFCNKSLGNRELSKANWYRL